MRRWQFALTLAFASAFWAESVEGNFNPVAFTFWGWVSIIPLYGLHALILGRVAFSRSKPSFSTLYLCGVLFGLYEAYITKIAWTGWENDPFKLGGVSVLAVLVVVLWWHPFMAFMLPLAFVERYGIGGNQGRSILSHRLSTALDSPSGPRWMVAFGAFAGLYQISVGVDKPFAWPAGLMDALVLTLLIMWLRKGQPTTLQNELPTGKGLKAAIAGLFVIYLFCGILMNPQGMPGFGPQLMVWGFYALAVAGLLVSKERDDDRESLAAIGRWEDESPTTQEATIERPILKPIPLTREWLPFVLTWLAVSSLQYVVPGLKIPAFILVSLIGVGMGVRALWVSCLRIRHPILHGA